MKRILYSILVLATIFIISNVFAQETKKVKLILLISEQNIEGPKSAWWASEVDLSATEARLATKLMEKSYEIIEPSVINDTIKQKPGFRVIDIPQEKAVKLGNLAKADYLVLGKAVASAGANIPQSKMISCYANLSAKVIRIKGAKVVGYIDASGNSAHMDKITGGREALVSAAENLSVKVIESLEKAGGK